MKIKLYFLITVFLLFCYRLTASDSLEIQSDNLNRKRALLITNSVFYAGTYLGFYNLWYKNYDLTTFHFFDDSKEWLQVDKIGHIYSSYYLTKLQSEAIAWSGVNKVNALKYGSLTAFAYVSSIEILDGFSKDWGASDCSFVR